MTSAMGTSVASAESRDSTPPSSPPSVGPADSDRDSAVAGVAVSRTMCDEEEKLGEASKREDEARDAKHARQLEEDAKAGPQAVDTKYKALEFLLSQSKLYSTIMLQQMQRQEDADTAKDEKSRKRAQKREEKAEQAAEASQRRATRTAAVIDDGDVDELAQDTEQKAITARSRGRPKKETRSKITDYVKKEDLQAKAGHSSVTAALEEARKDGEVKPGEIGIQDLRSARQPDLLTGGMMRGYQLEGLEWLKSLYENGLNGILADEMGLGKTIQTISFLAFLREQGVYGPFLITAPLSTTTNWVEEFRKWTPKIPVVLYHGSKQEREDIRRIKLRNPSSPDFPVVCTSYEICMNDRKFLAHFGWKFIIIDEGHRIKNLNCRLIRELQSYQSANRLLITGTPLQNNLTELWSLLHFLMPEIFDKLEAFASWFDFSALKEKNGYGQILSEERQKNLVSSLHAILKPFLLRRVKADVEQSLPKKREYVLYAPMTTEQRELYHEILHGNSRAYLEDKVVERLSRSGTETPQSSRSMSLKRKAANSGRSTPNKSAKTSRSSTPALSGRVRKAKSRVNYEEVNDRQYFKQLEQHNEDDECTAYIDEEEQAEIERAATIALAKKEIANKKLQNPIMQLRLCCNSPHNFYWPFTAEDESDLDETIVSCSGKMQVLDVLLPKLFAANHKVLIFSQFKTQLDIISSYCVLRGHTCCRIDGSVPQTERQEQIHAFNNDKATRLFLLSTRAGGQGINLAAADTVILFDSDWNPQVDLQAQDRAHRIGQTRNVIVYRFATRGTVEEVLLERADGKRRLEKLVIQKGRFRRGDAAATGSVKEDLEELQRALGKRDFEDYEVGEEGKGRVLSGRDLEILMDRSDAAYERAEKGEGGGESSAFKAVETKRGGEGLLESLAK